MRHLRYVGDGLDDRTILAAASTGIETCEITHALLATDECLDSDGGERALICLGGRATVSHLGAAHELGAGGYIWLPGGSAQVSAKHENGAAILTIALEQPVDGTVLTGSLDSAGFEEHVSHMAQGAAFETHMVVDKTLGSRAKIFAAAIQPGSGMDHHIHPFDQFYFILKGQLHFTIGGSEHVACAGSLVAFPAGTVHSNRNEGPDPVLEITINVPQPVAGTPGVRNVIFTEA